MKKIVCATLIMALLAGFCGCGKKTQQPPEPQSQAPTVSAQKPVVEGIDVFGGKHFSQMLWGYYEAAVYRYTGNSASDTEAFREGMRYLQIPSQYGPVKVSALPLDIQMGSYGQFMSTFSYGGKYYSAYTETGKAVFRKAYMEKFGDLTAEGFQKVEKLLNLDVAQVTFAQPDGDTQLRMFAYEIRENVLTLYQLTVDEKYNVTIGNAFAQYHFLHDGGKLILDYSGVRREYLANGYKDQGSLRIAGYAQDESRQYSNLEGFVLTQQPDSEDYQIEVILSNDARPVDPAVTFDKTTGDFSLTWTKSAYHSGQIQHTTPRQISGKLIPCTGYGFNGFSGFYLLIEGNCYSYLVSEEEYQERKYRNVANADEISDLRREALAKIKISALAELEQAYELEEMPVNIDFTRGQISIDAEYLFGADSQDISGEGREFLQRFMEIYASVITKEAYAKYIYRIVIEGHTDAAGSYSEKQALSMSRADGLVKTCVALQPDLGKEVQFTGCAYDYPIYNDDGSVDAEKSNRMVFRFLLTDE